MLGTLFDIVLPFVALVLTGRYLYKALFCKCPHCGSKDYVPDHGLFFYCNGCHNKF